MLSFIGKICIIFIATSFSSILIGTMFIYLPVVLYTEAECLRKGYPEARVSIGLERYCMNLNGSITVQVDKQ